MQNRKLYIIGNGFDLWHGIPSAYWQFKEFVQEHDSDLQKAIEDYLPADENWSDLESALAEIDICNVVDDHEHFMTPYGADDWSDSGHHDFQYEVGRIVECLSTELRRRFGQWIRQLPIPTPTTASQRLQTIDPTARFLTFNYTSTLPDLYGVPDTHVLHIHGRANLPDDDLILGHAWNPQERQSLNDRPDIEEIDTRLMEAHSILDGYFSKTFKPFARLIEEHRPFFEGLTDVEEVCVLGHSLSIVDEPYFQALLAIPGIAYARWQVACTTDRDVHVNSARLLELGVQASSIITCSWSDV
jgi:hypothetical protein